MESIALMGESNRSMRPMTREEAINYLEQYRDLKLTDGTYINPENMNVIESKLNFQKMELSNQVENIQLEYIHKSLEALNLVDPQNPLKDGKVMVHTSWEKALDALRIHSAKEPKLQDAISNLGETISKGILTDMVVESSRGPQFIRQEFHKNADLNRLMEVYKNTTETMHELAFNSAGNESRWNHLVNGWENAKEGEFLDPFITSSTPIWKVIQGNKIHKRNEFTYQVFSGKGEGKELHDRIFAHLQGKDGIKVISEVGTEMEIVPAKLSSQDAIFVNNFNYLVKLLDLSLNKTNRLQNVNEGEFKTIKDLVGSQLEMFYLIILNLRNLTNI